MCTARPAGFEPGTGRLEAKCSFQRGSGCEFNGCGYGALLCRVRCVHRGRAGGNVLETHRADDDRGDGYIAEIEILRGDLAEVLYDDTRDTVEHRLADRIAELKQVA